MFKTKGGAVVYEPDSVISFRDPGQNIEILEKEDLLSFLLKWSDEWCDLSLKRLVYKWGVQNYTQLLQHVREWTAHRRRTYSISGLHGQLINFIYYNISKNLGAILEKHIAGITLINSFLKESILLSNLVTNHKHTEI